MRPTRKAICWKLKQLCSQIKRKISYIYKSVKPHRQELCYQLNIWYSLQSILWQYLHLKLGQPNQQRVDPGQVNIIIYTLSICKYTYTQLWQLPITLQSWTQVGNKCQISLSKLILVITLARLIEVHFSMPHTSSEKLLSWSLLYMFPVRKQCNNSFIYFIWVLKEL